MSDTTQVIAGGCLCGKVRYESTVLPHRAGYCHCNTCKKARGGIFQIGAAFQRSAVKFTQGKPRIYKSADFAERGFCAECGSPLIFQDGTETHAILIGTLDHPEDWPPTLHSGIESQIPWDVIHDDLPRCRSEEHPDYIAAKEAAERAERR